MKSGVSHTTEESFIRAYTDQIADTEHDRPILIETDMHITQRRGILTFSWSVFTVSSEAPYTRPLCRYVGEYPNSTAGSLAAFLYSCAIRLEVLVENSMKDEEQRPRAKGR